MTLRFCTVAGALALLAIAVPAWAASTVTVTGVWSRPADQTGVVYATIENASGTADSLLSASSPVAKTVQIHESMPASPGPAASGSMAGMSGMSGMSGMAAMVMKPVSAVAVPAGGTVQLKPGSYHIMLIGLAHPLKAGETFPVTLKFRNAGTVQVQSTVRSMSQ